MTIELKRDRNHLVCSWEEPKKAVFQGREVVIKRLLMRRLRLNANGEVRPSELSKLGSRERERAVRAELARLRRSGQAQA